jgi:hypothetical protein
MTQNHLPRGIHSPPGYGRLRPNHLLWLGASLAVLLSSNVARAAFHLWAVTEIYTSADGSVQFVKLSNGTSLESSLNNHVITCSGPLGTHSFTFTSNLNSTATAGKTFLIGTANLASVPGGLTPDYLFTNAAPFLFINGGGATTVGITGSLQTPASYTNLPTDGQSSLTGSGSSLVIATNSPKNFAGTSNSIVPVRFTSASRSGTNMLLTFATATGTNGTAGPNYEVQTNGVLASTNWATVTNVPGNGTVKTVATPMESSSGFFRLRVP